MKFAKKDILYEDMSVLVCRKASGMAVQSAGPGKMDLESTLKNYLAVKNPGKGIPYLGVVQRLDQPVEGRFFKSADGGRTDRENIYGPGAGVSGTGPVRRACALA